MAFLSPRFFVWDVGSNVTGIRRSSHLASAYHPWSQDSRRHTGVCLPTSLQDLGVDFSRLRPVHRSNNYDIGPSNGLISSAPADHRWSTRGGGFVCPPGAHWSAHAFYGRDLLRLTPPAVRVRAMSPLFVTLGRARGNGRRKNGQACGGMRRGQCRSN